MGLESASYLNDLTTTNPTTTDPRSEGDNHIRMLKTVLKATFPGMAGAAWRRILKSSGPVTPAVTENMTVLECTAAFNVTPATGTLGNGWMAIVWANGADVTIDPNSTEVVNGQTTLTVPDGNAVLLVSTGTASAEFLALGVPVPTSAAGFSTIPVGTVSAYAGSSAPTGWLVCDGSAVSRTTYAGLFAIIGETYGAGDSVTTFNVPDLEGRVIAGLEATATRLTSGVSGVDGGTLGASGGDQSQQQHTHTGSTGYESNDHTHSFTGGYSVICIGNAYAVMYQSGGSTSTGGVSANHTHAITMDNTGSGSSENVQPTLVMNYIIKT